MIQRPNRTQVRQRQEGHDINTETDAATKVKYQSQCWAGQQRLSAYDSGWNIRGAAWCSAAWITLRSKKPTRTRGQFTPHCKASVSRNSSLLCLTPEATIHPSAHTASTPAGTQSHQQGVTGALASQWEHSPETAPESRFKNLVPCRVLGFCEVPCHPGPGSQI